MVRMEPVQQLRDREAILPKQQQQARVLLLGHHHAASSMVCASSIYSNRGGIGPCIASAIAVRGLQKRREPVEVELAQCGNVRVAGEMRVREERLLLVDWD